MSRKAPGLLSLALLLGGIGQARADMELSLTGYIYQNTPAGANNATVAEATTLGGTSAADASFATTSINYDSSTTGYTPKSFLGNPTFNNQSFNFFFGTLLGSSTYGANASLNQTYFLFDGKISLTAGKIYTFSDTHDDGAELIVGGKTIFSSPSATTTRTDSGTFTATTSGLFQFDLAFGETGGPPAVLKLTTTSAPAAAVPEPSTITMAGIGLVAFGGYKLRRRKQVVA